MSIAINTNKLIHFFAGIGLLNISACSSNPKKENTTNTETTIRVTVGNPVSDSKYGLTISGQIEAAQSADISTRVMGYITKITVKVGDQVGKGQLLATISNDDITAKRAQVDAMITEAEAGYRNAKKDYERFTVLYKQQSASAKELDNITLQYNSAEARLLAAKQMRNEVNASLSYTSLKAPFSGTITQKMADAGSMASPGIPLLTIEQSNSYQVSASVPESEISLIREGIAVNIRIDAVNKTIKGVVAQINQSSASSGGQYVIKIHIADNEKQGLFAGMYANVIIPGANIIPSAINNERVMVPVSAIEYKDQLTGLYTVGSNHTALLRWVRLGRTQGKEVEVLSGLAANEQFIVAAEGRLYNGASVKIK